MKKASSTRTYRSKQKINLKDLPKRVSLKEFQRLLMNAKDTNWSSKTVSEPVLAYSIEYRTAGEQESFVRSALAGSQFLDLENTLGGKVAVKHAGKTIRMDCLGKSVLGSNYSVIRDPQQGMLFLDHGTKSCLRLAAEIEKAHYFTEKFQSTVEIRQRDKSIAVATIRIQYPQRLRYEIWLDTDKAFEQYRGDVICHTLGCTSVFAQSGIDLSGIADTGVPVQGRLFREDSAGRESMISSFEVKNYTWKKYDRKDFSIPAGYQSLKELNRKARENKKPTRFGKPVRFSEIRNRTRMPERMLEIPGEVNYPQGLPADGSGFIAGSKSYVSQEISSVGRFSTGNFEFPTCFDETYASLIANVVDEKMLDDIKYMINGISKRLGNFSGNNGNLTIPWMDQFKAHSDALSDTAPGGGLYLMLHDEAVMGPSHPMKKGLLDKLAVKDLGNLLASGDNLAGLSLTAGLQARVNAILADGSVAPVDRFIQFTPGEQGSLIDAYVFKKIGTIPLTYPSSTGTQTVFHDLLDVRLDNIEFTIDINNQPVIDTLAFDSDSVHLVVKLPDASGKAFLSRWPSARYWEIVGISGLACLIFPPACALLGAALLVGLFVGLDFAFVTLDLANIEVDAHIRLLPNAANVLQPDVDLKLDADVSASYLSVVPTGVHQILSAIYTIVLNTTDLVIDSLETQLKDKLNDFLKKDLNITYPPRFGPVPLTGISNNTEFAAGDNMFVMQGLNAGTLGVICPYITQVDREVKSKIFRLRNEFKSRFEDPVDAFGRLGLLNWPGADFTQIARYYLGTVLSQNFINHYIYTLWRTGQFNYDFSVTETEELYKLLRKSFGSLTGLEFDNRIVHVHLWPAVPPRTVFTPKPASEGMFYSTTFFDDVRICFEFEVLRKKSPFPRIPNKMEFLFSAQAFTEIGFGGYNPQVGKLDILKVNDRVFDIYFDLNGLGAKVIHPEIQSYRTPAMQPAVNVNYSLLDNPLMQDLFSTAMQYALANRNSDWIPRAAGDDAYLQRYPVGDNALQLVCELVPFQGNLYISQGLSGVATAVYENALDIDAMDKNLATLIRAFT